MTEKIRVRFAPSPTGFLHVGGLRTALYNFLFAKNKDGEFLLRIEDTDQSRLVEGATENILQTLKDFDLNFDDEPIFQSKRLDLYKKYSEELVDKKAAYYCFCTPERLQELRKSQEEAHQAPKYDKHCLKLSEDDIKSKLASNLPYVVRLNVPTDQTIHFTDLVYGEIKISSNEVDDQVLLKSDGFPTYHLANVVDDHEMQISHVIRGEEWIPSTPKHIVLYSAFGWESPQFAHLPLLLSKSRKKLSKREGDVSVKDFLTQGYLPEALLNFVAMLGWNPKTEQEIFSLDELIKVFSLDKINKAGAIFDLDKLDWFNAQYIRKLSIEDLFARISSYLPEAAKDQPKEFVEKILKLEQERLKKLSEIGERIKYFFEDPKYDASLLIWKKSDPATIKQNLKKLSDFLSANEPTQDGIKKFIEDQELKTGEVLWPLRVSLTGLEASPGPFEIIETFLVLANGKEIVTKRVQKAIDLLA